MGNIDLQVNKRHLLMPCPCTKCLNHIEHKVEEVQFHLFRNGIDLSYTNWTRHGEKDEPSISTPEPVNATTEFVDDTYFASDIPTDGLATVEMVNATKDNFDEDDLVKFQELLLDAEKPLYEGCPDFTKLSAIVKLLNLKGKYGASDKFFTELLGLIKKMLPAGNEMVEKTYQAKKVMKLMGSGYKKIHIKVDNKTQKVYENIPAKVMWLGISADGVDVNIGNRHHSVWPVLTVIYNLPPWFCMKRKYIMLSGVDTYDVSIKDNLNLHTVVLWTINDYPALGTLCGCPYSVFKGYVVCGKDTNCVRLSASSKQIRTLLHVLGKTKDEVNAQLDLAELGVKPELFAMQEEDKATLPPAGYTLKNAEKDTFCEMLHNIKVIKGHVQNKNKPEGCIAEETIAEETIEFFSEYHKSMETIGIPPDKHETDENEVERELAIDKESVSETVRWISYGPRAIVVKYDAYNINGYIFRTKCHDGKVYQNSGVSVEAIDLHISKEVATTRQAYYYGVLQEIWVLDYRFRQIPLFKCDWVNHKSGGVKRDKLGYTLVDLNNLGHKVDPFVLASQALQVFYVKDPIDKKLSIVSKTPPKNYKDTYFDFWRKSSDLNKSAMR
ncbi:putative reverse transcriptase domain-containing protein [Tanacetum coccineum]